jgi:CheY-like chemotaxis protein
MNRDSWAGATHQNHYISSRHVEGGFGIHFAACMRVLVIDDNDDFRKLALLWFQIHGIEAEGAANGVQGLEFQRRRPASVIVTDIFMPEKEGIETIQDLRRLPGGARAWRGKDLQEALQARRPCSGGARAHRGLKASYRRNCRENPAAPPGPRI